MEWRFRPPISASLSPNTERDDVLLALRLLFSPLRWKTGDAVRHVEDWFNLYFNSSVAVSFNSGRSALFAVLCAFDIGREDEVLVQAFTCVAVPNSVLWTGAVPVYVDIDETFNVDLRDAENKITKKTKAIIVQHTFGIPAQIDRIVTLAKKYHIIVIEDCAHSLGATYQGRKIGSFGDAAFFSFGRDKVVSSVWGGMALINDKCQMTNAKLKLKKYQEGLLTPSIFWIFQQLLHPVAFSVILASYNIGIGKILLVILQKLRLLSLPVYPEEKIGQKPDDFPAKYPNALAILLVNQLAKLDRYNITRQQNADLYREKLSTLLSNNRAMPVGSIFLRFPLLVEDSKKLVKEAKREGILLGNWYHNVIDPTGVDFSKVGYRLGACPMAEYAADRVVNLPTRISKRNAEEVLSFLQLYSKNK